MKIPKSTHSLGDKVLVRSEESEDFLAFVSRIEWAIRYNRVEYEVTEPNGCRWDGYTDEWLTTQPE